MTKLIFVYLILTILMTGTCFAKNTNYSYTLELIQYESILEVQDLLCIDDCDQSALIEQVVSVNKALSNEK